MKLRMAELLLLSVLAGISAAAGAPSEPAPETSQQEEVCDRLLKDAHDLRKTESFPRLDQGVRWRVHATLVNCGAELKRLDDMNEGLEGLADIDPANAEVQKQRIRLAAMDGREPANGAEAIEQLAATAPEAISAIDLRTLVDLTRELKGDTPRLLKVYRAIFDAGYVPPDPLDDLDFMRAHFATLLTENGDTIGAAEQFKLISDPAIIAEFFFDRRFDSLEPIRSAPPDRRLAEAVQRQKDRAKSRVAEHPGRLRATLEHLQALRVAGEFEEAERASRDAVARTRDAGAKEAFSDYDEQAPWILNERAYVLYDLGRNDEARKILAASAKLNESGSPNVSQTINYASLLSQEGRFKEALEAIATLDEQYASVYGRMWAASVRLCAAAFLKGGQQSDADLQFLRDNEKENDSAFARAMLCMNDAEAYATHLMRRLGDPDRSTDALRALQRVNDPQARLPTNTELAARRAAVLQRDDVQASINAVGRVLDLPFYPIYWGSY